MALTRKFLRAMGVEDDKLEQIIEAHVDTVEGLKNEIAGHKETASRLEAVEKELSTAKQKLAEVSTNGYEDKYKELAEEYEAYKNGIENEKTHNKKTEAYTAVLKDCGIDEKRIPAILRLTDLNKLNLTEDGKVDGIEDVRKHVETEWADFKVAGREEPADEPEKPIATATEVDPFLAGFDEG